MESQEWIPIVEYVWVILFSKHNQHLVAARIHTGTKLCTGNNCEIWNFRMIDFF